MLEDQVNDKKYQSGQAMLKLGTLWKPEKVLLELINVLAEK